MEKFEIRDLRAKEKFVIDDVYLDGYAKFCGINATGVYISLCRHADKQQSCFPSKKKIAEELNISERSVFSALCVLEKWKIIKIQNQGRNKKGTFNSNIYFLLDKNLWKNKPQANNDTHRRHVVPYKETHIEGNTYKGIGGDKNPALSPISDIAFPLSETKLLNYFLKGNQRHIHLIGKYADFKRLSFQNRDQLAIFIKQNVRHASALLAWSDKEIFDTWVYMDAQKGISWKLSTTLKYINQEI